jgi:hypothetical protein
MMELPTSMTQAFQQRKIGFPAKEDDATKEEQSKMMLQRRSNRKTSD